MRQESRRALRRLRVAHDDPTNRLEPDRRAPVVRSGLAATETVNHQAARLFAPDGMGMIVRRVGVPAHLDLIQGQPAGSVAKNPGQVMPEDRPLRIEGGPQVDVAAVGLAERAFAEAQADAVQGDVFDPARLLGRSPRRFRSRPGCSRRRHFAPGPIPRSISAPAAPRYRLLFWRYAKDARDDGKSESSDHG